MPRTRECRRRRWRLGRWRSRAGLLPPRVTGMRVGRRHRSGRLCGAHAMTRAGISGAGGRSRLHRLHVVAGMRVGRGRRRSRRCGSHAMIGMRVRLLRCGSGSRSHIRPGMSICGGRLHGHRMAGVLGDGRRSCCRHESHCRREQGDQERFHVASPWSGRTVTTLNIPACMWNRRWQ